MMTRSGTSRYLTLDAMRGVAAMMVALLHLQPTAVPHGYLAVDFFFALSGFVLARAYETRLRDSLTVGTFFELRILRLWPLFFIGVLLGSAYGAQQIIRGTTLHPVASLFVPSMLLNLVMIPSPLTPHLYAANPVFWSIFTEILVNLAFARIFWKMKTYVLLSLAALLAIALAVTVHRDGHADGGVLWAMLPQGLLRTGLSFVIGMIVARNSEDWRRRTGASAFFAAAALCILLLAPAPRLNGVFDLVMIVAVFPTLIAIGAVFDPQPAFIRVFAFLGDISYALYATHAPISFFCRQMASRLHVLPIALAIPFLLVSIALAAAVVRFWDEPVRRYLGRKLALRRSAMPTVL